MAYVKHVNDGVIVDNDLDSDGGVILMKQLDVQIPRRVTMMLIQLQIQTIHR